MRLRKLGFYFFLTRRGELTATIIKASFFE